MRILFLTFILSLTANYATAQVEVSFPKKGKRQLDEIRKPTLVDINGLWEGEISQATWDGQPAFNGSTGKLHVEITQNGREVEGLLVCRAKFADNKGYLSYDKYFTGIWNGDVLEYQDVRVENYINTNREFRHLETCLKKAELSFYQTKGAFHLEGNWEGNGHVTGIACIPGKISLTKVNPDDIAIEYASTANINFAQKYLSITMAIGSLKNTESKTKNTRLM